MDHRLDEQRRTQHPRIVNLRDRRVLRELQEQRSHDGADAQHELGLREQSVEVREEGVPLEGHFSHVAQPRLAEQPHLTPSAVVVRMGPEERLVRRSLHPPRHELGIGIAHEATHVGTHEAQAGHADAQEHGRGRLQVRPLRHVVPGPDGAILLTPSVEGAGQNEGTLILLRAPEREASAGCHVQVQPVDVVPLPAFYALPVQLRFLHGHLGPIEDRRLVHVIPREQVQSRSLILVQRELLRPPLPNVRTGEVRIGRAAGPAPAVVVLLAAFVLDVVSLRSRLVVDVVARVPLDVGIDDGDHLPALGSKALLHLHGVGEERLVPREVLLLIGVLNIQPDHVDGEVVVLEALVDLRNVLLVLVVPPALVKTQREHRGQIRRPRDVSVLRHHALGRRAGHEEEIKVARLAHPVRVLAAVGVLDVHEGLTRVVPEDANAFRHPRLERHHEGNGTVQRHRIVQFILEHVKGVQAVRVRVLRVLPSRGLQRQRRGVFRNAVDVRCVVEEDVHANRTRAILLVVRVAAKLLVHGRILLQLSLRFFGTIFVDGQPILAVVHHLLAAVTILLFLRTTHLQLLATFLSSLRAARLVAKILPRIHLHRHAIAASQRQNERVVLHLQRGLVVNGEDCRVGVDAHRALWEARWLLDHFLGLPPRFCRVVDPDPRHARHVLLHAQRQTLIIEARRQKAISGLHGVRHELRSLRIRLRIPQPNTEAGLCAAAKLAAVHC
mmetsp:Transcript_8128/g.30544  ORF Transcript_8128/g.30544 Transcript_8128/m.30544 type:complete len:725 (+) Transcript_8128:1218-3392(+)